jgi:hypothetical protein
MLLERKRKTINFFLYFFFHPIDRTIENENQFSINQEKSSNSSFAMIGKLNQSDDDMNLLQLDNNSNNNNSSNNVSFSFRNQVMIARNDDKQMDALLLGIPSEDCLSSLTGLIFKDLSISIVSHHHHWIRKICQCCIVSQC